MARMLSARRALVAAMLLTMGASAFAENRAAPGGPDPEMETETEAVLEALRERTAQIAAREAELAESAERLVELKQELADRTQELILAEERLAATIAAADGAAERDVRHLVAIYENVDPKSAATIFAQMDHGFAAGLLAEISPPLAAEILAAMDATDAYALSLRLASRNLDAGRIGPPEVAPAPGTD